MWRKTVDGCAAHVIGKLSHLAERGDHAKRENAALARRQGLFAPHLAPAILGRQSLKLAIEVIDVRKGAVDIGFAEHVSASGETAVIKKLVHDELSI